MTSQTAAPVSTQGTLKGRYQNLVILRAPFLFRARQCAKLTIPTLVPPEGATGSTVYPTPFQSLGARGLNNLASKLLLTLLPPNSPFFRLTIDDFALEQITQKEGMRAEIEEALGSIERSVANEIETSAIRTAGFEGLKHLLAAGNVLLYLAPQGGMRVFPLSRYVAKRDPMGNLLETITQEVISYMELPEDVRQLVGPKSDGNARDAEDILEVYTQVLRSETGWTVKQEINGQIIESSRGTYPMNKSPWMALRYFAVDNEDYGRGFVEEYLGDLLSLEGLTKAIVKGSAAAAKVLFLVRPNGSTKKSTLTKAESGAVEDGNADDVSVLQMDKFNDFRVALETINGITERLSFAFLLNTAIQRNGERVTAEEIRFMANELESGLGGAYATLSQEFQLPLVRRVIHNMERQKRLPVLPEGLVKPAIITGVDAIGRGNDRTRLDRFLSALVPLGPEVIQTYLNIDDLIKRFGVSEGIDMKGLVRSKEEIDQSTQDAQMQQMMQQGIGPAINAAGGMMKEGMKSGEGVMPPMDMPAP